MAAGLSQTLLKLLKIQFTNNFSKWLSARLSTELMGYVLDCSMIHDFTAIATPVAIITPPAVRFNLLTAVLLENNPLA